MRLQRRIVILVMVLIVVLIGGTAGFVIIEGWSVFDGLYMTVTTLTTIGYGETHPLSPRGRFFNLGLIAVGFVTLFALIGTITQALIELEMGVFKERRMERQLSKIQNHYIVCGVGRVGRSVAKEFDNSGVAYVIVESDAARAKWALDRNVLLVTGDATREDVLHKAGVERARGLVAAVSGDAQNIYITLTARELNPNLKIVARAAEEAAEKSLRRAGADLIISPYSYTGHRIAQSLLRPNVVDFLDTLAGPGHAREMSLHIEELRVGERSELSGKSLKEAGISRALGVVILALKREGQGLSFNPSFEERLAQGDYLIAVGENSGLKKLESLCGGVTS